jgi:protein-S-isoprenylcysteine O-methyltransferase Ste14
MNLPIHPAGVRFGAVIAARAAAISDNTVEDPMANSRQVGGLVGPTVVAVLVSEFPIVQPHLYDAQIPPVVYLSGVLMFVAGLAVVRAHNIWERNWTVLVTLCGWFFLLLGLVRMFAASQYRQATQSASPVTFIVLEGCLLVVGLAITFKAYRRS